MTEIAIEMRNAIVSLAGERGWSETRERWLERAARAAGISFRSAKSLFYVEEHEPRASTVDSVRRAVEARNREEAKDREETRNVLERLLLLEQRMAQVDPEFFGPHLESLRAASSAHREATDRASNEDCPVD